MTRGRMVAGAAGAVVRLLPAQEGAHLYPASAVAIDPFSTITPTELRGVNISFYTPSTDQPAVSATRADAIVQAEGNNAPIVETVLTNCDIPTASDAIAHPCWAIAFDPTSTPLISWNPEWVVTGHASYALEVIDAQTGAFITSADGGTPTSATRTGWIPQAEVAAAKRLSARYTSTAARR